MTVAPTMVLAASLDRSRASSILSRGSSHLNDTSDWKQGPHKQLNITSLVNRGPRIKEKEQVVAPTYIPTESNNLSTFDFPVDDDSSANDI